MKMKKKISILFYITDTPRARKLAYILKLGDSDAHDFQIDVWPEDLQCLPLFHKL